MGPSTALALTASQRSEISTATARSCSVRRSMELRPHIFLSLAGDLDLVVGNEDGELYYIENTGTSTAPAFVQRTGSANPFDGMRVGQFSTPALGDLDGDGTLRQRP